MRPKPRRTGAGIRRAGRAIRRWLRKAAIAVALVVLAGPPLGLIVYRVLPPPLTPLMVIRWIDGEGLRRDWKDLGDISPHLRAAVIAGEDNLFCQHHGFDMGSIEDAYDDWMAGERTRGASTISMQTAKNLFLWPGRNLVRKVLEAYVTVWMELLWPKRRIEEVYLNIAEWGPGLYGAQAAAQHYFRRPASRLTRRQAALMAAVLPNPRAWSPARPTAYIQERGQTLERRMRQLGPLLECVGGRP